MLTRLNCFKYVPQVIEGKSAQNVVKRFQQKIQDFLSGAPEDEAVEETTATNTEANAELSVQEGMLSSLVFWLLSVMKGVFC